MPPYEEELNVWQEKVSIAFPNLSKPQATVLALYSYGMIWTRQCGQSIVSVFLGLLLGVKAATMRQRLREWHYEAAQKRGQQRREVVVQELFAPLLRWVLRQWSNPRQVVLALDVTYLRDRWAILCVSVVYGKTALPVAWKIVAAHEVGAWHPYWVALLAALRPAMSTNQTVYVVCDRGLYSPKLFAVIRRAGWHVWMRIRPQGCYRRKGRQRWQALSHLAYRGMPPTALRVTCFKGKPLVCVLWVKWDKAYDEACLMVSDVLPRQVQGNPYPLRMWIEMGFKQLKRGGLHWEHCKTPDAARMERLLIVLVLAHAYLVRQGQSELDDLALSSDPARRLSLFTLGAVRLLARTLRQLPLTETYFAPYVFPSFFVRKKTYP